MPISFPVGSLIMDPAKLLFLVVVPWGLFQLLQGRFGRVLIVDKLFLGFIAWMTISMFANHDAMVAIQYSGANALLLLGGYLSSRASIRSKQDFLALTRFLYLLIVFSLPFVIYEAIFDEPIVLKYLDKIPGIDVAGDGDQERRFGIARVQLVFDHPIHFGVFCSLAIPLLFIGLRRTLGKTRRLFRTGLASFACVLSMSSGAVLAMGAQYFLFGWDAATKSIRSRWSLFGWLMLFAYIVIELASTRSGLYAVAERLAFNPATARARKMLLQAGFEQISNDPLLGFGFYRLPGLPFWLSGSLDNYWLLIAVTFGVPAFLLYFGSILAAMILIGKRRYTQDRDLVPLRLGWMFMMASLCFSLLSVAVWGRMSAIVAFMFGAGIWMATKGD